MDRKAGSGAPRSSELKRRRDSLPRVTTTTRELEDPADRARVARTAQIRAEGRLDVETGRFRCCFLAVNPALGTGVRRRRGPRFRSSELRRVGDYATAIAIANGELESTNRGRQPGMLEAAFVSGELHLETRRRSTPRPRAFRERHRPGRSRQRPSDLLAAARPRRDSPSARRAGRAAENLWRRIARRLPDPRLGTGCARDLLCDRHRDPPARALRSATVSRMPCASMTTPFASDPSALRSTRALRTRRVAARKIQ